MKRIAIAAGVAALGITVGACSTSQDTGVRETENDSPAIGETIKETAHKKVVKHWETVKTFNVASATKTSPFTIPEGTSARISYAMLGDTNNALTMYRVPKEYMDLLLNEIGPQHGRSRIYDSGQFYLDVMGSGTIKVQLFR